MAQTLAQMRHEFADIKKLARTDLEEQQKLVSNVTMLNQHLQSGFKLLSVRLTELMDGGHAGATLDDFNDDREVVTQVQQLSQYRDECKRDANAAQHKQNIASGELDHRLAVLKASLTNEIGTRGAKFSSKILRVNQSVKDMRPLLDEVETYADNSPDLKALDQKPAVGSANSYEQAYNALAAQAVNEARRKALKPEQQKLVRRVLDANSLLAATKNAKIIYDGVVRQASLADQAKKARKAQGLSEARAAAKKAVADVKLLAEPYAKASKDAAVWTAVSKQPRGEEIKKRVSGLLDMQKLVNAKAQYILDLRM